MGQFDSPTEAALVQLKNEQRLASPFISGATEKFTGLGSKILALLGQQHAASIADLFSALTGLAASKDEANLIYFGEALVDDIGRLYRQSDEMRLQVESILQSKQFYDALANATLHITRTNVDTRLRRLAHVMANGVREDDLEPESLDDMMRAATVLTERDIDVLRIVYEMQHDMVSQENLPKQPGQRTNELQRKWQVWWAEHINDHRGIKGLEFKNSGGRLQSAGLVGPMPRSFAGSPTQDDLELYLTGMKFYERLQEISEQL